MSPELAIKLITTEVPEKLCRGCACTHAESLQLCPTLCDPVYHNPPGFSVHKILHTGILQWVAISSSWGSFQPRFKTCFLELKSYSVIVVQALSLFWIFAGPFVVQSRPYVCNPLDWNMPSFPVLHCLL